MKILVNATACRVAGGRTVALNFLRCYREGNFPHDLLVVAPPACGYEELAGGRVTIRVAPGIVNAAWARLWADHVWSRGLLADEQPDVLFAMGSIAYPTSTPQLVLYHWPYVAYREDEVWKRMGFADRTSRKMRRWLFGRRAPFASRFAAEAVLRLPPSLCELRRTSVIAGGSGVALYFPLDRVYSPSPALKISTRLAAPNAAGASRRHLVRNAD